jgi:predicted P-loop ATPase
LGGKGDRCLNPRGKGAIEANSVVSEEAPPEDPDWMPSDDDAPDAAPKPKCTKKRRVPKPRLEVADGTERQSWERELRYKADGSALTKDPGNAALLIAHLPEWAESLSHNDFSHTIHWAKEPPKIDGLEQPTGKLADHHLLYVQHWFAKRRHVTFSDAAIHAAIVAAAMQNRFHPPRDYLKSLTWDGKQRLPTWLARYFGAKQSEYTERVGIAWMISAVARIMRPGCKADYMLVLEGKQGAKKSSALAALFGDDWFIDSQIPIGSDESYKKLQGKWGVEIAELDAFRGKASSQIKGFITSTKDTFRPSYGRVDQDFPRTCVFVGTTNEKEYLVDRTGNRRFWPITVGEIDRPAIQLDRDQLWAEALVRFESGEQWWLEDEKLARREQRKREVKDPWLGLVAEWIEKPLATDKDSNPRTYTTMDPAEGFSQAHIFQYALNMRPNDMDSREQQRLGAIMTELGYIRLRRRHSKVREYRYYLASTAEIEGRDGENASDDDDLEP